MTFELIVLFSALTAFFGALALSALPQFWHAAFSIKAFARATDDSFFVSVDARDRKYDESALRQLFEVLLIKAAVLIHPTRMALSGETAGPPLFDLVAAMGREATVRHLASFIGFLRQRGATAIH